ncbi:MAG: hypothetical protein ABR529_15885 [Actinomycetota bacterium]
MSEGRQFDEDRKRNDSGEPGPSEVVVDPVAPDDGNEPADERVEIVTERSSSS